MPGARAGLRQGALQERLGAGAAGEIWCVIDEIVSVFVSTAKRGGGVCILHLYHRHHHHHHPHHSARIQVITQTTPYAGEACACFGKVLEFEPNNKVPASCSISLAPLSYSRVLPLF